jgi:hypothetical protein
MMENMLKDHAMLYKEGTWYREEIDLCNWVYVNFVEIIN